MPYDLSEINPMQTDECGQQTSTNWGQQTSTNWGEQESSTLLLPGLDVLAASSRVQAKQTVMRENYEITNERGELILKADKEYDCARCCQCDCKAWRYLSDQRGEKVFVLDMHCNGTCCCLLCIPMVGCLMHAEVKNMDGSLVGYVRQRRMIGIILDFEDETGQTVFTLEAKKCLCGSERFPVNKLGMEITAIQSTIECCRKPSLSVDFPSDMSPKHRLLLLTGMLLIGSLLYEGDGG
eukprot:272875_1